MNRKRNTATGGAAAGGADDRKNRAADKPTARETFAIQFRASFRAFWLTAVGIVNDHTVAEDVVQEAAIVALNKLDQFEQGTNFQAWMGRIVRYVALNTARKERKRRASPGDADILESQPARGGQGNVTIKPGAGGDLFDSRVSEALADVSDIARTCLLLRVIEEMSYKDISNLLDIPEGTAMSHVHRARRHLRERLADAPPTDRGKESSPK